MFTQVNIPIFSEQNGIPFFRRLEFEASWRHDQYSDVKGTSNPKVAFNWAPIEDFTIRGTWGNSFRAPVFGEISPLANVAIAGQNLGALAQQPGTIVGGCQAGVDLPPEGSGAWKLLSSFGDGTPGSASVCPGPNTVLPNGFRRHQSAGALWHLVPGRLRWRGSDPPGRSEGLERSDARVGHQLGNRLRLYAVCKLPDRFQHPGDLLRHQDEHRAARFRQPEPNSFNRSGPRGLRLPGADRLCERRSGAAACTTNLLPTTCAAVPGRGPGSDIDNPRSPDRSASQDADHAGSTTAAPSTRARIKIDGIDFQGSYDWDWGDIGAFNVGITGTYYLHNGTSPTEALAQERTCSTPDDQLSGSVNEVQGVEITAALPLPRSRGMEQRAVVDHRLHELPVALLPHPERAAQRQRSISARRTASLDAVRQGGSYPVPSRTTPTSFRPTTRSICRSVTTRWTHRRTSICATSAIQLVVQNVMDSTSAYGYRIGDRRRQPVYLRYPEQHPGRTISLIVTKEW